MPPSTRLGVQLGINGAGPFGRRPEEDLPGVLRILADLGYDGAEVHPNAWYDGPYAARQMFADAGLELAALHVFETDLGSGDDYSPLLDDIAAAACPRLILTAHDKRASDDFRMLAETLDSLASAAAEIDVTTHYHPHHVDFWALPDEPDRRGVDVICDHTDKALVRFNLDIYWMHVGGADPVTEIRRLADRADYYHVKDGDAWRSSPLGLGEVPVAGSLRVLSEPGIGAEWVVYEDPKPALPPTALCRAAKEYLGQHGFTGRSKAR